MFSTPFDHRNRSARTARPACLQDCIVRSSIWRWCAHRRDRPPLHPVDRHGEPEEIAETVAVFRDAGGRDLVLLHCVSGYPTPAEQSNLRRIPALAAEFGCPVGLSDHTLGIEVAIASVALGACLIEKHFTLAPCRRWS